MPFFNSRRKAKISDSASQNGCAPATPEPKATAHSASTKPRAYSKTKKPVVPFKPFQCQLAHGSPTGLISGFANIRELYAKIAEAFDISASEILFCTLNTHKVDMDHLLCGQLALDDFIFAHLKGQKKEFILQKTEEALGLTITDNGAGYAFIKRIRAESSVATAIQKSGGLLEVGDYIEKVNDVSMTGKRHFEVAQTIRCLPVGESFTLRLIAAERSPLAMLASRSVKSGGSTMGGGKKTIRLKANGTVQEEEALDANEAGAVNKINSLVEQQLGVEDCEMAQSIFEMGMTCKTPIDLQEKIEQSPMQEFGFPFVLIADMWGVIDDLKRAKGKHDPKPVYIGETF